MVNIIWVVRFRVQRSKLESPKQNDSEYFCVHRLKLLRSGFKTSDQVQGQGAGRSRKRSIHGYVSICRRPATQPLGLRWGFETASWQRYEIYVCRIDKPINRSREARQSLQFQLSPPWPALKPPRMTGPEVCLRRTRHRLR